MYARGHEHGTRTQTATQSSWYAEIEAQNIQAVDDAARAAVTRLAQVVGDAVSAMPEAANRIARAASLVQTHQVWPLTTSGSYLVGSQTDTAAAHLVTRGPWTCTCADHTHRHTTCKHQLAVMITVKLGTTYQPSY